MVLVTTINISRRLFQRDQADVNTNHQRNRQHNSWINLFEAFLASLASRKGWIFDITKVDIFRLRYYVFGVGIASNRFSIERLSLW